MMKPKGKNEKDEEMLEYIEDIVGTNQYKEPILLMNAKVEELVEAEDKQVRSRKRICTNGPNFTFTVEHGSVPIQQVVAGNGSSQKTNRRFLAARK